MAEILLFTITIQQDQTGGTGTPTHLDVGGQFASYYEDSDGSILVRDLSDDSLLTSSDFSGVLSFSGGDYISEPAMAQNATTKEYVATAEYSVCSGSNLKTFTLDNFAAYPFANTNVQLNHYSCATQTCDLLITSATSTSESSAGNDGTITVVASSSGTIEYSLNPFFYGAGNSSGSFTGLSTGNYVVYARDQYNCVAQIDIFVGSSVIADYGELLRIGYKDINGNPAKFEISQKNYGGSVTEITSAGIPVVYSNQEKDQFDVFKSPLRASSVTVSFPEQTKFGYRDLYTNDSREYLGIWYKDTGSGYEELWRGYLTPSIFSAPYTYLPDISLTFIDGLNRLDLFDYPKLYSDQKLITIIAEGLKKTDLNIPIHSGINVYEDSHNTAATDDPLDQTYIDQEAFKDDDEQKNYKEVLENILQTFGARLIQWKGAWRIQRLEETIGDYDYRVFDKDGAYSGNGTYSPQKYLRVASSTAARGVFAEQSGTYEILGAFKTLKIINNLKRRESILENYSFEFSNTSSDFWSLILGGSTVSGGVVNIENRGNVYRFNNSQWTSNLRDARIEAAQKNIQYVSGDKIKISFDVGVDILSNAFPYMIIKARVKVGSNYLLEDGTWTTTASDLRLYPSLQNGFQTVEFEAQFPATTTTVDTTLDVRIYDYQAKNPDYGEYSEQAGIYVLQSGLTAFRALSTDDIPLETRRTVFDGYLYFYTLVDGTDVESLPDILRPDDYATTTNERVWKLDKYVKIDSFPNTGLASDLFTAKTNRYFYVDDVRVEVLPNGQEATETETIQIPALSNAEEEYELEIYASDLPTIFISSGKYIYDSLFRLSNGTNTTTWSRDSTSEALTIQQILAAQIARQYATPTEKISGTVTTTNSGTHLDISPLDVLIETQDGDKIYYINGIVIEDKNLNYQINLIDSKATVADDGGTGGSFNGAFSSGFGGGFDTILN